MSRPLYEGLLRIKNDKQLAPVVEWLNSLREQTREKLETSSVVNVQVEQGKAQILSKILAAIENSPETLEKFK